MMDLKQGSDRLNKSLVRALLDLLLILAGSALYAVGFDLFLRPHGINGGGFSGIGLLVAHVTGLKSIGGFVALCNIPLFLAGWKRLGRRFFFGSLLGMLASSIFLDLFVLLPGVDVEPLLAAVCGGLCSGVGLGLVFLRGASTGGLDIVARLVRQKLRSAPIGRIMLAFDGIVALATGLVYLDLGRVLYTAVALYAASLAIDAVIYGRNDSGVALIISSRYEDIAAAIDQRLARGATLLRGMGAYTRQEKTVLLCAVKSQQVGRLQALVAEIDPDAFLILQKAHQVLGEGFGRYSDL